MRLDASDAFSSGRRGSASLCSLSSVNWPWMSLTKRAKLTSGLHCARPESALCDPERKSLDNYRTFQEHLRTYDKHSYFGAGLVDMFWEIVKRVEKVLKRFFD